MMFAACLNIRVVGTLELSSIASMTQCQTQTLGMLDARILAFASAAASMAEGR